MFPPRSEFSERAHLKSMSAYRKLWRESVTRPESFWGKQAKQELQWQRPFKKVLQWKEPFARWFVGGQLNVSANCLDRWLGTATANKAALIWEGEPATDGKPGEERVLTYAQLHREVCRFANVLKRQGIGRGDRVLLYMPMIPEAAIAMLACTRIGAVHSVVFGGFSAQSVADRIQDSGARMVVTADGGYRRGAVVPLKKNVDEALALLGPDGERVARTVEKVVVVRRCGNEVHMAEGRDLWWHRELEYVTPVCPPARLDSEAPLFILYTSGSTGKPKGILHSTAGYLLGAKMTSKYVFDLRDEDVYWCTADVGWVTGHSYIVYGPLSNGATAVMYEGAPNWPEPDRFWRIIEKYRVSILYTAPTAIRAFMKWGDEWPKKHDLSSLRLLGSVGEPINPEAWMWFYEKVGQSRCPIVDTWWQTETGSHMIAPIPGAFPLKPGSCTMPLPGIVAAIVDEAGHDVEQGKGGFLVIKKPFPSQLRTLWGDPDRFRNTYFPKDIGNGQYYLAGDSAYRDKDGYFWIMGRIDDVLNVSGHRLGTMEIESALVAHPSVAEAAVVGKPHAIKGEAVVAFVVLKGAYPTGDTVTEMINLLRDWVAKEIGPIAKPEEIRFGENLPKTRSGKIMRRLLRTLARGEEITQDISTLENPAVLEQLKKNAG